MQNLIKFISENKIKTCEGIRNGCEKLDRNSDVVNEFDTLIKAVHMTRLTYFLPHVSNTEKVHADYIEDHQKLCDITTSYMNGVKIDHEYTPLIEIMLTDGMEMNTTSGTLVFDEKILL